MDITPLLKKVIASREKDLADCPINDDGLKICPKCNTPLQCFNPKFEGGLGNIKLPIMCECQKRELKAQEEAQARQKARERREECFGNASKYERMSFESARGIKPYSINTMKRYANSFDGIERTTNGIILSGSEGSGKTYLLAATINALIDKGYHAAFTTVHKINAQTSQYITAQSVINELHGAIIGIDEVEEDCLEGRNLATLKAIIDTSRAEDRQVIVATRTNGSNLDKLRSLFRKVVVVDTDK